MQKEIGNMYYKTIGEFLEKTRITYNITLSKLCEGICSISTYARYEKDCFLPDKFTLPVIINFSIKHVIWVPV